MSVRNVEEILVLSPMQRLMLISELSNTGSILLRAPSLYRLSGVLDHDRLLRAWQAIVDRHAALRTCFLWEDLEAPVQVVRSRASLDFRYEDLSGLAPREQGQRLSELTAKEEHRGIDLRKAPLLRVLALRLTEDEWRLLVTRHHLVMDRWCLELMFDEIFQAYGLDDPDAVSAWPAAGRFRDYLQWLKSQDDGAAMEFWRRRLAGLDEPSLLFASAARRAAASSGTEIIRHKLGADAADAVRKAAAEARVSPASLVQGGLGVVLAQRLARRDVVFGLTVSGRPPDLPLVEKTMGSFINSVPMRLRFDEDQPVGAWLRTIQETEAERKAHEYLSLADIHECSQIGPGRALFDVLLLLHSPLTERLQGPGFALQQVEGELDSAFPLTISAELGAAQIELIGVHNPLAVPGSTASELLAELGQAMLRIASHVDQSVSGLVSGLPLGREPGTDVAVDASRSAMDTQAIDGSAVDRLRGLWCRALGVDDVGLDDDFFAMGGTSIQAAALFADIERHFSRHLPLSTLFKAGSVRLLLEALDQPIERDSPLVEIQPLGDRTPLFVVPGVGGNVVGLESLARACGPTQPFFGFQSRGLDGRDAPLERIEDIAADYVSSMPARDGDFALCGICWGAVVAFEMARQFAALGQPPRLLFLLDPVLAEAADEAAVPSGQPSARLQLIRNRLSLYKEELKPLGMSDRLRFVGSKIRHLAHQAVDQKSMEDTKLEVRQRRVTSANLTAHARYRPSPYNGRAVLALMTRSNIAPAEDPRLPWTGFLVPETPVIYLPGETTGEAIEGQNAVVLAEHIAEQLAAGP